MTNKPSEGTTPQAERSGGPLCDNCGKAAKQHYCWTDRSPYDNLSTYHPSEARAVAPVETPKLGTCKRNSDEHTFNTHGPLFPCVSFVPTPVPTRLTAEQLGTTWRDLAEFNMQTAQKALTQNAELREEIERLKGCSVGDLVIDICRELYDRFAMGGWEPQDAHQQVAEMLAPMQAEAKKAWQLAANLGKERTELRAKLAEQDKERDLYALLRGICEEVIDWLATLSYDGIWETKNVLDHPLTKDIRIKLQQMYDHPLDNKLLIRTDVLEAKLERAEAAEAEAAALREALQQIGNAVGAPSTGYASIAYQLREFETVRMNVSKLIVKALSAAPERGKDGK